MAITAVLSNFRRILPQGPKAADSALHKGMQKAAACRDWIETAVGTRLKTAIPSILSTTEQQQLELALQYRAGQIPATDTPKNLKTQIHDLRREKYPHLSGLPKEFELNQIKYLCKTYPAYAKKLLNADPIWTEKFFIFCLQAPSRSWCRGKEKAPNWVDIFVQYPHIADLLMQVGLHTRLGLYPENIHIDKVGVCLQMDLKDPDCKSSAPAFPAGDFPKNLESTVPLKNRVSPDAEGLSLKYEEIFKLFSENSPDIQISEQGIINWNSRQLSSKNDKNTRIPVEDPHKWLEYQPCVELSYPEQVRRLYPQIAKEMNYVFVLKPGSCSFNLLIWHNAKYRLYSSEGDYSTGPEEKMIFFPLSNEQGKKLIHRVAEDIKKNRSLVSRPQSLDIQCYLDELFGTAFYDQLFQLAVKHLGPSKKNQFSEQLEHIKKSLDPLAFEAFIIPLVKQLVDLRDAELILQLIGTSFDTLNLLLQEKIPVPTKDQIKGMLRFQEKDLSESLKALLKLTFDVLHPFSEDILKAEQNTFLVKPLLRAINAIPWKWLQDVLRKTLVYVLSSRRGYYYEESTKKTARYFNFAFKLKPESLQQKIEIQRKIFEKK